LSIVAAIGLGACAATVLPARPTERARAAHASVTGSPAARNAACASCHEDIAREWRASLHRQSAVDPVYRRAFAREPLAFCSACHDPLSDPALGTGCISCHDGHGAPMRARPCADCHDFASPDGHDKMQLTSTEHRASVHAASSCASCHMPRAADGHPSHAFHASRAPDLLRRAATITATRTDQAVIVTFAARDVGHALPTGDIFRRLRIEVVAAGEGGPRSERILGRKTKLGDDQDDRPFAAGGARASVAVPIAAPGRPLAWRVLYERAEHPISPDEREAVIEGSVELAAGTL
jgi:hypothetical protein